MASSPAGQNRAHLAAVYRECERFILTRACELIRMSPHDDIKGLVFDIRAKVAQATARAKAVKSRGEASMQSFHEAIGRTEAFLDEVDAAAAEMRGVMTGDNSNGGPPLDDLGNSPAGSGRVGAPLPATQRAIADAYVSALDPVAAGVATRLDWGIPDSGRPNAVPSVTELKGDGGPPRIPRGS